MSHGHESKPLLVTDFRRRPRTRLDGHLARAQRLAAFRADHGRLRLLCVWSEERAKRFPEAPTLREQGIDLVSVSPYGLAGPKGMDPVVVRTLHDAFKAALFDPAHLAVLERYDMLPAYLSSEDYAADARRQYKEAGAMIRRLGLRIE